MRIVEESSRMVGMGTMVVLCSRKVQEMLGMCLKLTHFQTNDGSESCRQRPSHVLEVFYKVYILYRKDQSIKHYDLFNFNYESLVEALTF